MSRGRTWEQKRKAIEKSIAEHYDGPPPWEVEGKSSEEWASELLANAAARSGPPPWEVEGKTIEEWAVEKMAREEELGRPLQNERGRFLDVITKIDWSLGSLFADHFGVASEWETEFVEWMVSNVNFAEKVDIVGLIVESRGLQDDFGALSGALRRANELRIVLAHAVLEPGPHEESIFLRRSRRGEVVFHKYTLDELRTYVRRGYSLNFQVAHLHGVIKGDWDDDFENPFGDAGDF